jgi:molybdopterin-guanine dinucleotide biosynthesis protein B
MNAIDPLVWQAATCALPPPAAFGILGASGSGKTTLLEALIVHLRSEGLTVSAVKRAHDGFDLDRPGKDSYRLREAGCEDVMLVSNGRWALLHEVRRGPEPTLDALLEHMSRVDLVLLEGFRDIAIPSIEVFRPGRGRLALWPHTPSIVAVATDEPLTCPLPVLDMANTNDLAAFILRHLYERTLVT